MSKQTKLSQQGNGGFLGGFAINSVYTGAPAATISYTNHSLFDTPIKFHFLKHHHLKVQILPFPISLTTRW